jgi:hypothetical protein
MQAIGLSAYAQSVVLRPSRRFQSWPAAGLLLFAMMFYVFGEEAEQREARPLAQGAVWCTALAAMLASRDFLCRRRGGRTAGA